MTGTPYFDNERERTYEELLRSRLLNLSQGLPCTLYLFGSRARNEARRGSDFDIGIEGLDEKSFFRLKMEIEAWVEDSPIPHTVDMVDFSHADRDFVAHAKKGAIVWKSA